MKRWTPLLLLPVLLAACSKAPEIGTNPAAQTIEVLIGSGPRLDILPQTATRTTLDEDGVTVKWQTNDRIALWAVNAAAQSVLEASPFSLYHYNASYASASFRGTVPSMPEDTYTYYAVSPVPTATDGLKASYDIPAVQDGAFHGEWDVMVATPIVGAEALREHDRKDANGISDNTDIVNLQFAHKTHVLKITLPKNDLGEPITEIVLTFPSPVVGRLTVDATDPAAEGVLSDAGKQVTLRFAEPKDAGDVVYAMIAPVTLEEGQQISIVASGESRESETRSFAPHTADRTFAAGHTTPINYNVPVTAVEFTRLTFHLAETGVNTLGEAINTFTVTAPEGWVFEDGNSSRTFDVTGTGDYTIRYRNYTNPTNEMSGFRVTYDSEHALLNEDFTMPALSEGGQARVEFSVPYLFEEDFSGVNGAGHDDDKYTGDASGYDLQDMNLPGWSGQRVGSNAEARAVRVHSRHEGAWGINAYYNGRITSAPLSNLKSSTQPVTVKITFRTGGSHAGTAYGSNFCQFGTTTNTGNMLYSDTDMTAVGDRLTIPGECSYTNIPHAIETLPAFPATKETRLSWKVTNDDSKSPFGGSYTSYYVYLDDIRVSIAQ